MKNVSMNILFYAYFFTICTAPMLRDVLPHQYVYYPINRCSSYNKHANNHVSSEEVMHLNGTCQWISVIPVTQTILKGDSECFYLNPLYTIGINQWFVIVSMTKPIKIKRIIQILKSYIDVEMINI